MGRRLKREYRLVLVEWRDSRNTDSYYLDDLIKTPKFRTREQATEWANKNLNKIMGVVDKDYTTDLYYEEWDYDLDFADDGLVCCLFNLDREYADFIKEWEKACDRTGQEPPCYDEWYNNDRVVGASK